MARLPPKTGATSLLVGDLIATFVFALEGGGSGAHNGLDVFGILVLAFVVALGGGIVRDVLLGDLPPAAMRSTIYPVVAFTGGVLVVLFVLVVSIPQMLLTALDAAGLGLFAVVGAVKARDAGLNPLISVLLGTVSGVGGGVIRDVLLNRVPLVLNGQIYASAGLAGAAVAVGLLAAGASRTLAMSVGGVVCFALRMLSVLYGWHLPRVS